MAQHDNIDLQRPQVEAQALALQERLEATIADRDRYRVDLAQLRLRHQALSLDHEDLEAEARALREVAARYSLLEAQLADARHTVDDLSDTLRQIRASRSWRLMAPFRAAVIRLRLALGRQP